MVYILEGTWVYTVLVWKKKEDKENFTEKYLAKEIALINLAGRGKKRGRTKGEGMRRLEEEGSGLFGAG